MSPRKQLFKGSDITVVIPTIGREQVLLDTIYSCLSEPEPPASVVVVDQSKSHESTTEQQLAEWINSKKISVIRPQIASQPAAMNVGLRTANTPLVLFLDDDIQPQPGFIAAHAAAFDSPETWCVVGQIIQPWQTAGETNSWPPGRGLTKDLEFPFNSSGTSYIENGMSGHMSVRRDKCIELGGFDENFKGAAYRFDTEFAKRVASTGGKLLFTDKASLKHLRAERGGTRNQGTHLASANPIHGVGDYYFAMRVGRGLETSAYCAKRLLRECINRYHLSHPWTIPIKLVGEIRAICWAIRLTRRGPAFLTDAPPVAPDA